MKSLIWIFCSLIFVIPASGNDQKQIVSADLQSATVYRTGAELVHTVKVHIAKGNNELIISGLSNQMDLNSILIGNDGNVTLMSVEFSTDYLQIAQKSSLVRRLEDSMQLINEELASIEVLLKTNTELMELLKANKEIRGTQTGLSVAELMKMMDYYKTKTLQLQKEISENKEKQKKLNEQLQRIRQQINEEEQKNNKTTGKLELQLLAPIGGNVQFTISYITQNAYWNPYYDLKVDGITKPLNVIYKAKMVQSTGIDWKSIKLALATSVPNQQGNAPVFNSWFLTYIEPVRAYNKFLATNQIPSAAGVNLQEVVVTGYGTKARVKDAKKENEAGDPLYIVNGKELNAEEFSAIDPNAIRTTNIIDKEQATAMYGGRGVNGVVVVTLKDNLGDYVQINENQLNITFDIDIPYDVPSNGKVQSVTLKELSVPASYKYYGIPKLDKDAYLLAEVSDWEQMNLLPGEANIIFEGTYIGKSFIDPATTQDTLNFTLGRDKRVVVKREKLVDYSSVKFLGNAKKQTFTYEITVKNNKKEKVQLLLKDQYPLSTNKDIEVELMETSNANVNNELGVLNWSLQLAPGEVKKVRFSYSVKYPKDKVVNVN